MCIQSTRDRPKTSEQQPTSSSHTMKIRSYLATIQLSRLTRVVGRSRRYRKTATLTQPHEKQSLWGEIGKSPKCTATLWLFNELYQSKKCLKKPLNSRFSSVCILFISCYIIKTLHGPDMNPFTRNSKPIPTLLLKPYSPIIFQVIPGID